MFLRFRCFFYLNFLLIFTNESKLVLSHFFIGVASLVSQTLEVNYQMMSTLDVNSGIFKSIPENQQQIMLGLFNDMKAINYTLLVNEDASLYEANLLTDVSGKRNLIAESVKDIEIYVDQDLRIDRAVGLEKGSVVHDKSFEMDWDIKNETAIILGKLCRLAETEIIEGEKKNKIKAWFATELPYRFGPNGFHGLPGLILALEKDGKIKYEATEIVVVADKSIAKPTGEIITKDVYNLKVLNARNLMRQ